jgi:chemotaxis methyl-accepting protein methylase
MTGAPSSGGIRVAGIGASAGGLEAMLVVLANLHATGRISYVVAQHMANGEHSDLVARLLGRQSALPVVMATDHEKLKTDTVYVIPSGQDGIVRGDTLVLVPPGPGSLSTPSANALLASIAESAGARGIGIVLSGTGSDGAVGCRAIRDKGGLTIAQDPTEARFDGMPLSAINTGAVSHTLSATEIGRMVSSLFPPVATAGAVPPRKVDADLPALKHDSPEMAELGRIQSLVLEATGVDFSRYKEETLLRRIDKRKETLGLTGATAYMDYIRRHPDEAKRLEQMFLVCVSSFFRDPDAFRALGAVLRKLLLKKPMDSRISVWVPGCATGDEAYTLAIMLCGMLGEHDAHVRVRITATDLSEEALAVAKSGVFRRSSLKTTDPAILKKYFSERGEELVISEPVRGMVRFDPADLLTMRVGGPYDLISCRNLLIYFKAELQDRLIRVFHQALNPGGLLFIGQSESLGITGSGLFTPIDQYHRVYVRRG